MDRESETGELQKASVYEMIVNDREGQGQSLDDTTFQSQGETQDSEKETEKEQSISDPSMAESLTDVPSCTEIVETSDEGKKKSKFKGFRSFFGKKKKKDPDDLQGWRLLKPCLSNSNINTSFLKQVDNDQPGEPRIKGNMGNKALSHDSIFMLDPEIERSTGKMHPSLESQRGRSLQRSHVSRTLPRTGTSNVHGALSEAKFGVVPRYVPRSGVWVAGSKITEIPPLRPRQPSISPPPIRSGTNKDLEEMSGDDELPMKPQMKASSHKILAAKKNYSEASTGTGLSQSSTACASSNVTQQPVGFSIPATTQGCLDSSAARHKMALNPRKQKKKKSLQASMKPKQDETSLSLISEGEKSTNNPKEVDQKKLNKDGTGTLNQDPSNKTEIYDQKIAEQASNTDPTGSMGYPMLAAYGRRRRRKRSSISGTNEYGRTGCLLPSCQLHILGDRYDYSHLEKTASDCPFRHLTFEKQTMEQFTTPQAESTTSQELLSDKGDMVKKNVGLEVKAKKASAPQPIPKDMVESMVSGPPLYHENGACGAKKPDGRASLLPMVGRLSKAQEEDILSVAVEAQVLRDPSHVQSGEEEASSHGLQNSQSKMELAQGVPTICKEKSPGNILQGFTVIIPGVANIVAEGSLSTERLSPRSLSQSLEKPEDEEVSSDSNSASEEGSVQEQRAPEHSFQSPQKLEGEQEGFPESESFVEMSGLEQNQGPEYSHKFLGKPQPEDASSETDSILEEGRGPEEMATIRFSRSLRKLEAVFSESKRFAAASRSQEKLVLQEPEDTEFSTESNSYAEKCNSADDWSSLEEDVSLRNSDQALGKPQDQREVSSVSKNTPKEWKVLVKQMPPRHPPQIVQQQVFSSSVNLSAGYSSSLEPVSPSCPFQPWVSPKFGPKGPTGPENSAVEWGIFMDPLPPRMASKRLKRSLVEQKLPLHSDITTREEVISMEVLPRYSSQPSVRPKVEKQLSLGADSAAVVGEVSMETLPPKLHSQSMRRPLIQQQVSASPRSTAVEGSISVDLRPPTHPFQTWLNPPMGQQTSSFPESKAIEGPTILLSKPLINPKVQQNMFSGSEGITSVEPLYPKYSPQSITNPQVQQMFSEDTAVEKGIFMDLPPGKHLMRPHFHPQMTVDSVNISSQWANPEEPVSARHTFQPWMNPTFQENVSACAENPQVEGNVSTESVSPRHPLQSGLFSAFKPASANSESSDTQWGIPKAPPIPKISPQPPMRPVMKQPVSMGSASASAQWSGSLEPMPRNPFQSWVSSKLEQQTSAGPENSAAEGSGSMELRPPGHHLQSQKRPAVKQEISSGSVSTSIERSCPIPPRYTYQPWGNPQIEQQASTSPESVTIEGGSTRDVLLSNPHSRSVMKHIVQKGSPSFEGATVEEGNSGRALPPEYPTQFSVRSKIQEMSSHLENPAGEEDFSKKPLLPRPSQSFVKFMAQQIFSESASVHGGMYADPLSLSHPFKSLLRPKMEHHVFSDWENADSEGGTSLKKLPMKHPLQSVGRPEGPQEGLSYSENVPSKWSSSKGQVPTRQFSQVLGKFEYQQEVSSVSDDSPEEWRISEEHMPSRHPSQTLDGSEQPPILSPGSGNVPVDWSSPAEASFPVNPFQEYGNPGYQQQTHSSSKNVAAEGTIFENNPGNWSLSKCPVSPKKTKKFSQVSEDFIKSIPVSANKPGKFNITLPGKTPISGSAYIKEEVLQSGTGHNDGHTSIPSSEAEVENLFGVRLRRIPSPQKFKNEKRDNLAQFSSVRLGPIAHSVGKELRMRRRNPQVFLSTPEDLSDIANFAEKQQNRNKLESMLKRPPVYIPPGKSSCHQSDCAITEAVWITRTKQRQRGSQAYVPKMELKPTSRTGAKDETKDPRYGGAGSANESQVKKILTSTVHIQEKMPPTKPPKPAKSVAFEDQKTLRMSAIDKETKRSSSLPAGPKQPLEPVEPVEPDEPVWFSMAKKKAKAWSHIVEITQ
ncbi:acrosomal protein KIAA1210 homolog [Marmota monax]|nr:acrosomal protein KIAA1210 homolog [Marmota monax]